MVEAVVAAVVTTTLTVPNAAVDPEAPVFVTATLPTAAVPHALAQVIELPTAADLDSSMIGEVVERRVDGDGAPTGDDIGGREHNADNALHRLVANQISSSHSERRADSDLTSKSWQRSRCHSSQK